MSDCGRILYCHCAYAQVVPPEVKGDVLRALVESGQPFDAVSDLCEMSARRDPALARLASDGPVRVVACYPRAVKWLFHGAGHPLPPSQTQVFNMRTDAAQVIIDNLLQGTFEPNLPTGKVSPSDAPANPSTP